MIWFSFVLLSSPASSMAFALADASAWNTLPPDSFMANSLSFFNSLPQSQPANEIYSDTLFDNTACPLSTQSLTVAAVHCLPAPDTPGEDKRHESRLFVCFVD